jgi:predicted dehydrogenase
VRKTACAAEARSTRVAIIGYGGMADRHLDAFGAIGGIEVVGVSGRDEAKARAFGDKRGIPSFAELDQMLDEAKPDAVFICLPPGAHGAVEDALIARGIPFFIEKPLATDYAQASDIARKVQRAGLVTSVGYHWNYLDSMERAREFLGERKPVWIEGQWLTTRPPPQWWSKKNESGGQLVEQVTHLFDAARKLAGEAKQVTGLTADVERAHVEGTDVPEVSSALVQFENGAIGTFHGTVVMPKSHRVAIDVICDDGTKLEITPDKLVVIEGDRRTEYKSEGNPTEREDRAFLEAVRTGDTSGIKSTYADALRSHRLATRAQESADRGGKPLSTSSNPLESFRAMTRMRTRRAG